MRDHCLVCNGIFNDGELFKTPKYSAICKSCFDKFYGGKVVW